MVRSEGLAFAYGVAAELRFPDVTLGAEERLLVLGPSGSGKSTLIGLWSGLLTPTRGSVVVGETRVHELPIHLRDRWRGRHVGMVFQQARLLASQRVAANVQLPRRLAGLDPLPPAALRRRLASLGVDHLAERLPRACSVGERQRVGILRALATDPTLLLADEPTSALDRANALAVGRLLVDRAAERKAALVVVTHDDRLAPLFPRTLELDAP